MKRIDREVVGLVAGLIAVFCMVSVGIPIMSPVLKGYAETNHDWSFTYFGVSVSNSANRISTASQIDKEVTLSSATFKEDGSINKKGGKFVADSPADGASYYYTEINPAEENFVLQADVTVDQMNPSPDGQEGFALMIRDAIWPEQNGGSCMANLMSVAGTRMPVDGSEIKDSVGFRGYTGIKTSEASSQNQIKSYRYGWWKDTEGNAVKIKQGGTYRIRLEKTSSYYKGCQYEILDNGETGSEIGSYTYYIPAKAPLKQSIESYDELDDPMNYQEKNKAYVALVTARGINATFRNIEFTTSEWKASEWKRREDTKIDPKYVITSPETSGSKDYDLTFRSNADGKADIYRSEELLDQNVQITANTPFTKNYTLSNADTTEFHIDFTPDPEFRFSDYEVLSDYEKKRVSITVTQRSVGDDKTIYVKADGSSTHNGTSMEDAVDIGTALQYAGPGYTILLDSDTYTFSGSDAEVKINYGINGTEDEPIILTTEDGDFATFDFDDTGKGFVCNGNYWEISNINITGVQNNGKAFQLSGSHNELRHMYFYKNNGTGLQISGSSNDDKSMWPAYNRIINCTSVNNGEKGLEDADGFACKITSGEGNVFEGCIAAYNADDGWDLFAKITSGSIGEVEIRNSAAFKNGYLMVKPGGTKASFVLAEVIPGNDGSFTFGAAEEMEAGNGNGFKMGGSNMPGAHRLENSVAYENKAKGIDSNSGPDIRVSTCVSYNNGGENVALYTGNKTAVTAYEAENVISYRKGVKTDVSDKLNLQSQDESEIKTKSNYFWDGEAGFTSNSEGDKVSDDWFVSLDTSVIPLWGEDGTLDMQGLLCLKSKDDTKDKDETHTHDTELIGAKEATCLEDGYEVHYECKTCHAWFEDRTAVVPISEARKAEMIKKATGHSWDKGEVTKVPDYDDTGIRTYTCTKCGETKEEIIKKRTRRSNDSDDSDRGEGWTGGAGSISTRSIGLDGSVLVNIPEDHQPESGMPLSDAGGKWTSGDHGWTYTKSDGTMAKNEWMNLRYNGLTYWYFFDDSGIMLTKWFDHNGATYYFVPRIDGWRGRMVTGWYMIDGKWYYFEPTPGVHQGHMYRGTVTPDGHTVGADGSWNGVGEQPVGQKEK